MDKGYFAGFCEDDSPSSGGREPATAVLTIGDLARAAGITPRALRFYQSRGLLAPVRKGSARLYSEEDRARLELILQGKRLGFTLTEIRQMIAARGRGASRELPLGREKCVEQINLLERQRRDLDLALAELRRIYTGLYVTAQAS